MLSTAVTGASVCCIPPNGDVSFISRPSQNVFFDNSDVLQMPNFLTSVAVLTKF